MSNNTTKQPKRKRLSSSQVWVIELMSKGWQLFRSSSRALASGRSLPYRYGLQQGGFGSGGKSHNVHYKTIDSLFNMGIIEVDTERPKYTFKLKIKYP